MYHLERNKIIPYMALYRIKTASPDSSKDYTDVQLGCIEESKEEYGSIIYPHSFKEVKDSHVMVDDHDQYMM
jgi:hypothetical protein